VGLGSGGGSTLCGLIGLGDGFLGGGDLRYEVGINLDGEEARGGECAGGEGGEACGQEGAEEFRGHCE
jgi:hypothetical protein